MCLRLLRTANLEKHLIRRTPSLLRDGIVRAPDLSQTVSSTLFDVFESEVDSLEVKFG